MFDKRQMGGLEMALRAAGLAPVLDAANQLAAGGAIEKIMKLVQDMEGIKNDIAAIKDRLGIPADVIEGTAELRRTDAAPGSADRRSDVA